MNFRRRATRNQSQPCQPHTKERDAPERRALASRGKPTTRAVTIDGMSLEDWGLVARNNRDVAVAVMISPSPAALQVATDSLKSDRGPFSKLSLGDAKYALTHASENLRAPRFPRCRSDGRPRRGARATHKKRGLPSRRRRPSAPCSGVRAEKLSAAPTARGALRRARRTAVVSLALIWRHTASSAPLSHTTQASFAFLRLGESVDVLQDGATTCCIRRSPVRIPWCLGHTERLKSRKTKKTLTYNPRRRAQELPRHIVPDV